MINWNSINWNSIISDVNTLFSWEDEYTFLHFVVNLLRLIANIISQLNPENEEIIEENFINKLKNSKLVVDKVAFTNEGGFTILK